MIELTLLLLRAITLAFRGRHDVVLENFALRHQLRTLQRRVKRPQLRTALARLDDGALRHAMEQVSQWIRTARATSASALLRD